MRRSHLSHYRSRARMLGAVTVAGAALVVAQLSLPGVSDSNAAVASKPQSSVDHVAVFSPPLNLVGTVNLAQLGRTAAATASSASSASAARGSGQAQTGKGNRWHIVDPEVALHRPASAPKNGSAAAVSHKPAAATDRRITSRQPAGAEGFVGITGVEQAAANGNSDLEPPDQGLCAGQGYVSEFVNNALTVYRPDGTRVVGIIPSYALFKQPSTSFFSDPRCYYDSATRHWMFIEFIVGGVSASGKATSPSLQFIAMSDTANPLGKYHVWSFATTDTSQSDCPCFGDYDELGADDNGIYITTDEFSTAGNGYNGVVMYALSKELLENYANTGIAPVVFAYRLTTDAFGQPYIVAPTSTPQGALFARNTEYFLESNGNAASDDHLEVYALHDTSLLAAPAPPTLYVDEVNSEPYSFPPDALQKPGPRPLGTSVQDPEGQIQADFDSMMEPTYLHGTIYGQLDTAATGGNAVAWFEVMPHLSGNTLTASVTRQGYVAVKNASLIYPYTALSATGHGYMTFALSGPDNYPSAAYVAYGPDGPSGNVHIAAAGAAPEDGFTCYAAFVGPNYGGCRWGDYSMGVASGGRVYLATEMIPNAPRDYLTNWGTFIWSAPPGR